MSNPETPEKTVALTGFEPFADFRVNPSWEAAKELDGKIVSSFTIKSFRIPLVYQEIKPAITRIVDRENPAIIISLGQSYHPLISLEKVAINLADLTESTTLYNCKTRPQDETLEKQALNAYFSTLPLREILRDLRKNHIPTEISYNAGTFGCNQIFFHLMHKINSEGSKALAGFIHVPCLPSQAAQLRKQGRRIPSMSQGTITNALEIAIKTTTFTAESSNMGA